ncbi:MAG: DinB family protein [Anaerolineaceae bacterium]|nr:DinB family protein [Anaerolineaceae bacterium]
MYKIITNLYQFNNWANKRILDGCAKLTPEQYHEPSLGNFGSVHATLVHILAVQWLWLQRWQGQSLSSFFEPDDFADLAALRNHWQKVEGETQAFIGTCSNPTLAKISSYRNFNNEEWSYPLWQMMLHQANHATQHRSEIALLLTEWGHSPGMMDFLYSMDVK